MSNVLKALSDYPDLDFLGGWTLEKLENSMVDWYKDKYRELTEHEPALGRASRDRIILQTCAYYIFQGYKISENNARMNCIKYATGDYLDALGAFKRVSRQEAAAATTTLRYSMDTARTSATGIPAGSRVTAGDGVYFATIEYAEIPIGGLYVDVQAICNTTGESGNLYGVGELTKMVDIVPFIDFVENLTVPEGGTNEEDEESYRESIYLAPDGYSSGGSPGAYEYWVNKYSSAIIDTLIYSPSPRVMEVMCLLEGGELPGEEFLSGLAEYLAQPDVGMLTDVINVINPSVEEYGVSVTYYINQSDSSVADKIQERVTAAVDEYILWQKSKIGRDINPSVLTQLILNAGAKRVAVSGPAFQAISEKSVAVCTSQRVIYGGLEDD